MTGVAIHAGDVDSSQAPGLTSVLRWSMKFNAHRGVTFVAAGKCIDQSI